MNRLFLVLMLALLPHGSFAAVYKCERDGKIEYQATPCANGREISSRLEQPTSPASPASVAASRGRQCVGKELRISFTDMPLKTTLQVLADFSGNKLVADPSVSGSGAFSYECVPWDTVLQDIASRHNLAVKVENGTIYARRR